VGIVQRSIARTFSELRRSLGMEHWVFLFVLVAIGWTIVRTVVASTAPRTDLTFSGARDETSSLIRNRGSKSFAIPVGARASHNARAFTLDTMALTGDTMELATLAKGGFLRDQIESFNDAAIRDAWEPVLLRGESGTGAASSRSLLRLARTDDGSHVVSARLNPSALIVLAPGSESEGTLLRTAGEERQAATIGPRSEALLGGVAGQPPEGECRAKVVTATERLMYCGSLAGFDVNRRFDLRVVSPAGGLSTGPLTISRENGERLWVDGVPASGQVSVRSGQLVFAPRFGARAFSTVDLTRLAGRQWINGRSAYQLTAHGSLRHFARAGRVITPPRGESQVTLSLDAELTRELDASIREFVADNVNYIDQMSVVIADIGSGELKTVAESTDDDQPLIAFEPMLLGSMSKPMTAAAILSQQPALAALEVTRTDDRIATVRGLSLSVPLGNPANGCSETITFDLFLQCSSNQFAAELLIASLQESAGKEAIVRNGRVETELLERSALASGLLALFDDADVEAERTIGRSSRLWQRDTIANPRVDAIPRDASMLPWVSRPWFVHADSAGIPLDWLARFAIGGWENRWTPIGAVEAYSRIATDRRVHLSVQQQGSNDVKRFSAVFPNGARAFRQVRRGLALAASDGTARGLGTRLAAATGANDSLVVLAKTGTLNEASTVEEEDGVFLKALGLVAGYPSGAVDGAPLRCGLSVVVYLQFRDDWIERTGLPRSSRLPDLHLQFARGPLADAMGRLWKRSGPCGASRGPKP
jgi:hypothetical protein